MLVYKPSGCRFESRCCHLTWCLNYIIKQLFYDKNILTKHVTQQKYFVVAKFKSNHWRCSKKLAKFTAKYLRFIGKVTYSSFIKKRLQGRCFPVSTAKFLRACILKNISKWLDAKEKDKKNSGVTLAVVAPVFIVAPVFVPDCFENTS